MTDLNAVNSGEISEQEKQRLQALYQFEILDTMPEQEFDGLTRLASKICDAPVSLINLLDLNRQWTKSSYGIDMTGTEMSRTKSLCHHTIQQDGVMIIPDLTQDDRFRLQDYVRGKEALRFYAGVPLQTQDGFKIGSICVLDREIRSLDEEQQEDLKVIADEVMARLELRRRERELEKVNRQKDKLMRTISHDLRNPLVGVIGAADFIEEDYGKDEELKELARIIKDSGEQMLNIVSDLLNSDLVDFGRLTPDLKPEDPSQILKDLLKLYTYRVKSKHIELEFEQKGSVPGVQLDKTKYSRIVANFISNAVKYTPEGGSVKVVLSYDEKSEEGRGVLVTRVEDTGIGIPEDMMPHLFNPGDREIRRSGTKNEETYGLGLSIAKKLTDLFGGSIDVRSTEGEGSTFTVRIPAEKADSAD